MTKGLLGTGVWRDIYGDTALRGHLSILQDLGT